MGVVGVLAIKKGANNDNTIMVELVGRFDPPISYFTLKVATPEINQEILPNNSLLIQIKKEVFIHVVSMGNMQPSLLKLTDIDGGPFQRSQIKFRDKTDINPVLGAKDLAEELSEIILNMPYEQGRMIGVFGRWGRGKTFLMNQVWENLKSEKGTEKVEFHAWKYQDTPATWAYLYEQFIQEHYKSSWLIKRIIKRIYLNGRRLGWWEAILFLVSFSLSFIWVFFYSFFDKIETITKVVQWFGIGFIINCVIIYLSHGKSAKDLFNKYYTNHSFTNLLGIQSEIQKELKVLLNVWKGWPYHNSLLILFVEDIDRCSEEKIIQIIDALRVLLEDPEISRQVIIIAAIDERILSKVIKSKYINLVKQETKPESIEKELNELSNEYLDKLFLAGIKLGALTPEENEEFLTELSKSDIEVEDHQLGNTKFNEASPKTEVKVESTESFKANSESQSQGETYKSNNKEEISITNKPSKLTKEELECLKSNIKKYENATPRKLRIFYYRYLIAKNLLIREYNKANRKNIWLLKDYWEALVTLIIIYSSNSGYSKLSEHLDKTVKTDAKEIKIDFVELKINREDYLFLLKTLEIVVAY